MLNMQFAHNDPDDFHERELTLHDCVAEKIVFENNTIRFFFPDGFWVTPNHDANDSDNTVRTDTAQVDFCVEDINDIGIWVFTRTIFRKTVVEFWDVKKLADAVNSGKCTIEFLYQYRNFFEQMWRCELHFNKKPYHAECQLYLPKSEATYRWNNLRFDRQW